MTDEQVREKLEIAFYNDLKERGIDQEVGSRFALVANHHAHIAMQFILSERREAQREERNRVRDLLAEALRGESLRAMTLFKLAELTPEEVKS